MRTGKVFPITGVLCVDGKAYRFMGSDSLRIFSLAPLSNDSIGWEGKSAGKIKATADSLVFRDIPANALLLLRNHTRGLDERIFIYENKTQLWK